LLNEELLAKTGLSGRISDFLVPSSTAEITRYKKQIH
jgi:hypothetical protein